ncbi:tyrosine--tRNA ligase [soil metagenome]
MNRPADAALLDDLTARGLVQDHTALDALRARLAAGPVTLYHGIDPTADSLHTGNLIGLLVLRRFQAAGHRPLALAGGATGMVGDPSGRSAERNLLGEETLDRNLTAITAQVERLLDTDGPNAARLVDNRQWTAELTLLEFLRDVGKHATVNTMVARESVKLRMAGPDGISFTEFSYMLLQAHDYLWLADHHDCELQVGGSDQWGNMVAGVDLIRRKRQRAVHALSWPLITAADGTKLGKTTGARVWLDPARTSPYRFYQHWMQADDRQVRQFLAQFTLLPVTEVDALVAEHANAPERREAQRVLAGEATALVHGRAEAVAARTASLVLFGGDVAAIDAAVLAQLEGEVPTTTVSRSRLAGGVPVAELLVAADLEPSLSKARRLLEQGGASVNNERVAADRAVGEGDLIAGRAVLLRAGKRRYALVVVD